MLRGANAENEFLTSFKYIRNSYGKFFGRVRSLRKLTSGSQLEPEVGSEKTVTYSSLASSRILFSASILCKAIR